LFTFEDRLTAALFTAALLLGLSIQSLLFGVSLVSVLLFWLVLIVYAFIPGVLAYWWLRSSERDWLMLFGMGWTVGLALQSITLLLLTIAGVQHWYIMYPIVIPILLVLLHLKLGKKIDVVGPPVWSVIALLALCGLATAAAFYYSPDVLFEHQRTVYHDIVFHAGNIAELLHSWPLTDPRIAGTPQNYHYFSYFIPIGIVRLTGLPITDVLLRLIPGFGAVLLAVQMFNAGRLVGKKATAGLVTAVVLLFHADVGWAITRYLQTEKFIQFSNVLSQSISGSMSTLYGLFFLAGFLIVAYRWLNKDGHTVTDGILCVLLAAMTAGSKSSAMPAVLLGLVGLLGWKLVSKRQFDKPGFSLLLIAGAAATAVTLLVTTGEGGLTSYIGIAPGTVLFKTPFYRNIIGESTSLLINLGLVPVWAFGYLGIGLVGLAIYLWQRQENSKAFGLWILFSLVAGLSLSLTFDLFGDERFFLDSVQLMLALVVGAAVVRLAGMRHIPRILSGMLLIVFMLPVMLNSIQRLRSSGYNIYFTFGELQAGTPQPVSDYLTALDWMRANLPEDAVLVTQHGEIFLSAFAERRTYYETARVGPVNNALLQQGVEVNPYPERVETIEHLYTSPDRETINRLIDEYGEVYLVVDHVNILWNDGYGWQVENIDSLLDLPEGSAELIYDVPSIRIYHLRSS